METKESKSHLQLDGGQKVDPLMSTRDYIENWWGHLDNPSTYERNFYRLFSKYGKDLGRLSIQFFHQGDDIAKEAKEKNVFGKCHSIGHNRLTWDEYMLKNSTLWLGYVDIHKKGEYLKTIKHTFITWNVPDGGSIIFDQILIKAVIERMDFAFSNYYAVPIPDEFSLYVEDTLKGCGKARTSVNYSVFMDHVTFASDKSTNKMFVEMDRLWKTKCPD